MQGFSQTIYFMDKNLKETRLYIIDMYDSNEIKMQDIICLA